jgi:5'-methylthioadenosine phosphorylase
VPWQANIQAMKDQGVTHILATTACGSLKEEIDRGHFVVVDQVIDFTKHRVNTFHEDFGPGLVHQPFSDPFDEQLRKVFSETGKELGIPMHDKGTVVTIEGPRFSSRAESFMFISWKADVINMSTATEVALANEAGIPYAAVAMATDYDCWREGEEAVTMDEAMKVFKANASKVLDLLVKSIPKVGK